MERLFPVYHKTNVRDLQRFLGVTPGYGQVMVVRWGEFGNVLEK
jgi:hypothetical protein